MSNPYESPVPIDPADDYSDDVGGRPPSTLVGHIRVVAVLLIVQGGLILLVGAMAAVTAFVLPLIARQSAALEDPPEFDFPVWFTVFYALVAGVLLLIAILHIWAGIQNFRYRQRVLGIVAVAAGLTTSITCYCAPTAIGLAIYGLIVYLNVDVAAEFRIRAHSRRTGAGTVGER